MNIMLVIQSAFRQIQNLNAIYDQLHNPRNHPAWNYMCSFDYTNLCYIHKWVILLAQFYYFYFTYPNWCIYVSVTKLSSVETMGCRLVSAINARILIGPLWANIMWIKVQQLLYQNSFKDAVYQMLAIYFYLKNFKGELVPGPFVFFPRAGHLIPPC